MLRPIKSKEKPAKHGDEFDVLVEPDADHTDEDILNALAEANARDVQLLARGFISAKIMQSNLEKVQDIGFVSVKRKSQMK